MSQRADLIKKIKSLVAKTVENGCTEAETITASEHAALLMQRYDLTFDDVEKDVRDLKYQQDKRPFGYYASGTRRRVFPIVRGCNRAIAEFFDCVYWTSGANLIFFGSEDDTSLAHSMVTMLQAAIEQETNA